ncbi:MAG: nitroreductase family protein [Oscillospiraceae bacterium]|jgi:nitroreductase|nr:nitroreductase family protein [Oscillospiraceae bacterium]
MEFFEVIFARYSYRGEFEPTPVPREDLEKIVTAGIRAPSAGNMQSQRFYVVTGAEMLSAIREIFPHPGVASAPALILIVSKLLKFEPFPPRDGERGGADARAEDAPPQKFDSPFELQDYGAAAENVLLAIAALGYATVWTDGQTTFSKDFQEKAAELLELPKDAKVRAVLPVGIPKTKGGAQPERKPFGELVKFI